MTLARTIPCSNQHRGSFRRDWKALLVFFPPSETEKPGKRCRFQPDYCTMSERRPMPTIHSRNTAESISVLCQSARAMRG